MQTKAVIAKTIHLTIWSVMLAMITGVLSAAPLRALRNSVNQMVYWLLMLTVVGLLGAFIWWPLAIALAAQVLLVGIYREFEEREFNLNQAAAYTMFLTSLILSSTFYSWALLTGKGWVDKSTIWLERLFERMKEMNLTFVSEIQVKDVAQQLPSAIVIFLMLSLAVALMFDRFFARTTQTKSKRVEKLTAFHVPDFFVWVFTFSLLGAFAKHEYTIIRVVSLNALNIVMAAYFFQGVAVMYSYFDHFRIGPVWRFLWTLLLIVQLPLMMSLLGLVDYWANLRKSFAKKAAEIKKRRIQE